MYVRRGERMKRDDVSHLEWKSDVQAAHAGNCAWSIARPNSVFSSLTPSYQRARSIMSNGGLQAAVRSRKQYPNWEQGIRKVVLFLTTWDVCFARS